MSRHALDRLRASEFCRRSLVLVRESWQVTIRAGPAFPSGGYPPGEYWETLEPRGLGSKGIQPGAGANRGNRKTALVVSAGPPACPEARNKKLATLEGASHDGIIKPAEI